MALYDAPSIFEEQVQVERLWRHNPSLAENMIAVRDFETLEMIPLCWCRLQPLSSASGFLGDSFVPSVAWTDLLCQNAPVFRAFLEAWGKAHR